MGTYIKNCITVAHKGICNRESQLYPGNLSYCGKTEKAGEKLTAMILSFILAHSRNSLSLLSRSLTGSGSS